MADFHEIVIVGGGIGGSALAAAMAEAGRDVLLLEQTEVFEDRVRGEWIAPWGVTETKRLGLYDTLMAAGGHHIGRHVTYDESRTPQEAEARTLPLGIFAPRGRRTAGDRQSAPRPRPCSTRPRRAARRPCATRW